mgnify:FL=1
MFLTVFNVPFTFTLSISYPAFGVNVTVYFVPSSASTFPSLIVPPMIFVTFVVILTFDKP